MGNGKHLKNTYYNQNHKKKTKNVKIVVLIIDILLIIILCLVINIDKILAFFTDFDSKSNQMSIVASYTVRFDKNTGTGTQMPNQEISYNVSTNLNQNTYTKDEYIFNGWNTRVDGNGTSYVDEAQVLNLGDITLYAMWSFNGHIHNLSYVQRVEPTCVDDGNIAYYKCLDCEKYYSDANAQNEITTSVVLPALGHNLNSVAKVDATCTQDGCNAYYKCSRCNKLFKDSLATVETTLAAEKIAALGHAFGTSYVKENSTYHAYKCSRCGVYDTSTHQAHTWSGLKQYSDLSIRYDYHYQTCTVSTCNASKSTAHNNNNGYIYENHGDKHLKSKKCSCGITYDGYEESHTYDQSVATSTYLKSAATCKSKAVYYKSCKCGAKGTATFTSGSVNSSNHNYVSGKCYSHANGGSAQVCSRCGRCKTCGSSNTSH